MKTLIVYQELKQKLNFFYQKLRSIWKSDFHIFTYPQLKHYMEV